MAKGPLRITRAGRAPSLTRPTPGTLDFALRSVRGGKHRFMEIAPLAIPFEPRLEQPIAIWAQLTPWQRRTVTLEELGAQGGLTPGEFLAAVVRAAFEFTDEIADLLVAAALPEVVTASVKRALTPRGELDRRLLLEHAGLVGSTEPNLSVDHATPEGREPK